MRDISVEVLPLRIKRLDQRQFLLPRSGLDLLLSHNRGFHIVVHLKPDQHLAPIASGKSIRDALAMLPGPLREIGCHSGVESPVSLAGHEIDGRLFQCSLPHLVIARSGATKQSRASLAALDCFAALAMTGDSLHLQIITAEYCHAFSTDFPAACCATSVVPAPPGGGWSAA